MTNRQFTALKRHFDKQSIRTELAALLPSKRPISDDVQEQIRRLLSNGWNTERLMRLCQSQFDDQALLYALHWAFPQAYYSVYAVLMAFLKAAGATETSHAAVLKKQATLVGEGRYPKTVSAYAHGPKDKSRYENVTRYHTSSTLQLDDDPRTWQTHICQLLNATRRHFLLERRRNMRSALRTSRNKPKKSLTKADWSRIAQAEGNTTILHFLYRKRIKANYHDIETYLHKIIDPGLVLDGLVHIVSCYNFVHEAFVWAIVGEDSFGKWVADDGRSDGFLVRRIEAIRRLKETL
jgi:hypothetical protein